MLNVRIGNFLYTIACAPVSLESSQYNNCEIGREEQYLYLPDYQSRQSEKQTNYTSARLPFINIAHSIWRRANSVNINDFEYKINYLWLLSV
jgi:hypothetical protein